MAFDYTHFQRWSDGVAVGANNMWEYTSSVDTLATIATNGYFNSLINYSAGGNNTDAILRVNDIIWLQGSDAGNFAQITAITPNVVVAQFSAMLGANTVATANIQNGAVTASKIAANAVATGQLDPTTIQYAKVPMTAAQWNGMYATPFQLIAAPGANLAIIVKQVIASMTFVSAQYAAGGPVIAQYGNGAHGVGTNTCGTDEFAAATIQGFAANSSAGMLGRVPILGAANNTVVNEGVFLSNTTGAFTTGDGTWEIHVWYAVVTL